LRFEIIDSKIAKDLCHKALQLDRPNPELVQKCDRPVQYPSLDAI